MNKSGQRQGRLKSKVIFWAFLLSLIIVEFLLYSYYFYFPATVNGQTLLLKKGSTVSEALQQAEVELRVGNLVDVEGKIIQRGKGNAPRIWINGRPANLSYELEGGERLTAQGGKDVQEEVVRKILVINPPTYFVGRGPFITLAQQGESGKHLTVIGALSGKILEQKMLKAPLPNILKRQNNRPQKVIALTFDDGPHGKYTPQILKILDEKKVKATFFVLGPAVIKKPGLVKQEVSKGHVVGNHSYHHRNLTKLTPIQVNNELAATEKLIKRAAGYQCLWFRPPGGKVNGTVAKVAEERRYRIVTWNIDPRDWKSHRSASSIYKYVVAKAKPGAVVLLHDGGGNQTSTIQALPKIIDELRAKGYALVTLDELVSIKH